MGSVPCKTQEEWGEKIHKLAATNKLKTINSIYVFLKRKRHSNGLLSSLFLHQFLLLKFFTAIFNRSPVILAIVSTALIILFAFKSNLLLFFGERSYVAMEILTG